MGPESNERVLIRNRNRTHRETQERRPREDRGRDWVMQPQAKGHLEPPEAGSGQEGPCPGAFGRSMALLMPPWGLLICGTSREYISIVNLWHFVTAAPCNEDTYCPKFSHPGPMNPALTHHPLPVTSLLLSSFQRGQVAPKWF